MTHFIFKLKKTNRHCTIEFGDGWRRSLTWWMTAVSALYVDWSCIIKIFDLS